MDFSEWAGMLTYGFAVLSVLILALGGFSTAKHDTTAVEEVELVQGEKRNISFDEGDLRVTVSGNTTVSGSQSSLRVNSTTYRNYTLDIDLEGLSTNLSRSAERRELNYTINVEMNSEVPEEVLVHGVSEKTSRFVQAN
jgi:hypothetical protein